MSDAPRPPEEPSLQRVPSGVPGLDAVLGGGWLQGGLYLVAGPPGAGKTTLANQLCFSVAARGERALYATLLVESHGRMVAHLAGLRFFRREVVGDTVHYLNGFGALEVDGPGGLTRLLAAAVRQHRARVLVLDGLGAVEDKAGGGLAYRQFLHGLAAHASLAGCTTLLLTTRTDAHASPALALVDGVVELAQPTSGTWTVRTLEVRKFRGSPCVMGKHLFTIDAGGVRVWPRIESVQTHHPDVVPDPTRRLGFGVKRLDEMLGGGLVAHSSTLLFGSPGTGKTLLGLHFLAEGARRGEPGLHLSFSETRERLVMKGRLVGLELQPYVDAGLLRVETRAPVETLPDQLAQELLDWVDAQKAVRVFVDGMEPLAQQPLDERRQQRFIGALLAALRARRATVVATQQTNAMFGPELTPPLRSVEAIVDNVVFLRYFELRSQLYRLLSVLKMRESDNDPALREFTITAHGVDVAATFESAEAILTGQARPVSGRAAGKGKRGGLLRRRRRPKT